MYRIESHRCVLSVVIGGLYLNPPTLCFSINSFLSIHTRPPVAHLAFSQLKHWALCRTLELETVKEESAFWPLHLQFAHFP
jgi:hypothetical protein